MSPPGARILVFITAAVCTAAVAREWKSADGQKTVDAAFIAVQGDSLVLNSGGKPTAFPLTAFAAADQEFARNAQYIADAARKLGPQSWEFVHPVEGGGGWICRLALAGDPKAPKLFTGETIFLATKDGENIEKGQRVENQLLFGAGGRTYHPLQGDPAMVRAFAATAEHATQVWSDVMAASGGDTSKQAPNAIEPAVELVTKTGLGVVIGRGLVAIDPELAKKGFKTLAIHHGGKDFPATVLTPKNKAGEELKVSDMTLVSCEAPVEPARIGTKKMAEVGQTVLALSLELNTTKKGFSSHPTVTRGIVSRLGSNCSFQHDARLAPENPGGFILTEKGDVLGFFFLTQQSTARGTTGSRKTASEPVAQMEGLGSCVSTQSVAALLDKMSAAGGLRSGDVGSDIEQAAKILMAGSVIVIATSETVKPRKIPVAAAQPAAGGPATGWSLSKSGTRHNAKCRFYDPQKPCQATDGKPCKTCGG